MELNSITNALGWTIINSLWHGLFILIILAIAMVIINPKYSQVRSMIAYACLLFVFAASIRTFSDLYFNRQLPSEHNASTLIKNDSDFALLQQIQFNENIEANTSISTWNRVINSISGYGSSNINHIVAFWLFGMLILTIRTLGGYFYMQKIKTQNLIPVDINWQTMVKVIATKFGIGRKVKIFESTIIKFPTVIGYFKPVILMPLGTLTGVPAEQIEMILAHELAHIKRTDYLLNLIQSFLGIIYFFNPAVWAISKIIRTEREYACDDLALSINADSSILAKALVALNQIDGHIPVIALSALGTKNSLLGRIKRMTKKNINQINYPRKLFISSILVTALITITLLACSSSMDNYNSQSTLKSSAVNFSSMSSEVKEPEIPSQPEEISPIKEIVKTNDITRIENLSEIDGKRKFDFTRNDIHWKGVIKDGKIVKLYKDGKKMSDLEIAENENFILYTLADIDEDMAQFEIDMQDFKLDMKQLKEDLKDIKVDIDFEHLNEIGEHFNSAEFKHEMKELARELEHVKDIDIDFDKESFKESMRELKDNLHDLKIDMSDLDIDLSDLKIDMKNLKVEMKKLKVFMSEMKSDLVNEEIIGNKDADFELDLDQDRLLVNDKKQPDYLHKRYLKMYKKHFGKDLDDDFHIRN